MGQLAILGHETKYNEINNIFEAFGVKIDEGFKCDNPDYIYYINDDDNSISIADSRKLDSPRLFKKLGYELYDIKSFVDKFGEMLPIGKYIVATSKTKYRIVSHMWSQNIGLIYVCETDRNADCVYITYNEIDTLATKIYNESKQHLKCLSDEIKQASGF